MTKTERCKNAFNFETVIGDAAVIKSYFFRSFFPYLSFSFSLPLSHCAPQHFHTNICIHKIESDHASRMLRVKQLYK